MPSTNRWQVNQRTLFKFVSFRVQDSARYLGGIEHDGIFQVTVFTDLFG